MALIVYLNVKTEVTYPFIYFLRRHNYRENNSQKWIHPDNRKLPPAPSRCGSQNPHIHKDACGKLAEHDGDFTARDAYRDEQGPTDLFDDAAR